MVASLGIGDLVDQLAGPCMDRCLACMAWCMVWPAWRDIAAPLFKKYANCLTNTLKDGKNSSNLAVVKSFIAGSVPGEVVITSL